MAVGRFTTTPSAPSAPCSQSNTTVCRKFGSRKDGAAIRNTPFPSGAFISSILPRWPVTCKRDDGLNPLDRLGWYISRVLCIWFVQPNTPEHAASLTLRAYHEYRGRIVLIF